MRFSRSTGIALMVGIFVLSFGPCASAEKVVVASTSLTGAIARAASAREVRVLTPGEVKHPPEYELKPSDLLKLKGAAAAVYGGYEKMVPRLVETSGDSGLVPLQVDTAIDPRNLMEQARKVAKVLGTEQEEKAWELRFDAKLKELRERLAPLSGMRAIVHRHAEPFAGFANLDVIRVLAPGELTPRTIAESVAAGPQIVVDILHFPMAKVIAENAKCAYALIINFPGVGQTVTLEDVFEYNTRELLKAVK